MRIWIRGWDGYYTLFAAFRGVQHGWKRDRKSGLQHRYVRIREKEIFRTLKEEQTSGLVPEHRSVCFVYHVFASSVRTLDDVM